MEMPEWEWEWEWELEVEVEMDVAACGSRASARHIMSMNVSE